MAQNQNPIAVIKHYLSDASIKARLEEILGKRAGAFGNSIVNVVRGNSGLQKCTPDSICSSAMISATMNLPIDPALGQAAIVPYKNVACFQLMYRGVLQLCIRSGLYSTIHCVEVYKDELKQWNPITGKITFNDPKDYKLRAKGNPKDVIGHYACLKLKTVFEKADYMSQEEVMAHAKRYSKAYQYDLKQGKKTSAWSEYPVRMGNKTVLLRLLKMYGVMSIELQDAIVAENQPYEAAQAGSADFIDKNMGSQVTDAKFEEPEPEPKEEPEVLPEGNELADFECDIKECGLRYKYGKNEGAGLVCDCGKGKLVLLKPEPETKKKKKAPKKKAAKKTEPKEETWICVNNHEFTEPRLGKGDIKQCPKCFTTQINVKV